MRRQPLHLVVIFAQLLLGCQPDHDKNNHRKNPDSADAPTQASEVEQLRQENQRLRDELQKSANDQAVLQSALDEERARLADTQARVHEFTQDLERSQLSLQQAHNAVMKIEAMLSETTTSNSQLVDELASARNKVEEIVTQMNEKVTELTAAKHQVEQSLLTINALEKKKENLESFLYPLVKPLQGFWQGDLEVGLDAQRVCKVFYQVNQINFKRVTACKAADSKEYKLALETGSFVDLFKQLGSRELNTNLEIHRQVLSKPSHSNCTTESYPPPTQSLSWTAGLEQGLDINLNEDGSSALTLLRGEQSLATADCLQILARPNRTEMEEAVAACKVLQSTDEQANAHEQIGCISQTEGRITWTAVPGGVQ